jgi:hypothetical protein
MDKEPTGGMVCPAGNYPLRSEESTRRKVIPLGLTSTGKKNPPEEWDFTKKITSS